MTAVESILECNARRLKRIHATFNPITGEGSVGNRSRLAIKDYPIPLQWIPLTMAATSIIVRLRRCKSLEAFIAKEFKVSADSPDYPMVKSKTIDAIHRLRCIHDFPYWAASLVYIKNKIPGLPDCLFKLIRPQRKFVELLEQDRLAGRPIRIVLLKARQWGGSTTSQLYMAWLQLIHRTNLNSLIIAHQGAGSDEIKDMFDRMIAQYPLSMLHDTADAFIPNEPKMVRVGKSGSIFRVPQRSCKIKIGSAERPDSCRGGDYALVHLSEVGIWKKTEGKSPEDIVASACTGVLYAPYTMIVYESTAKGSDNFFHREYVAAKKGDSQFRALFISWFEIDWNSLDFDSEDARREFANSLYLHRNEENSESSRRDPGKYLWWLWQKGATLEAINWYIHERAGKPSHEVMASECPSDDIEAFVYSGANVFDIYQVEALKPSCRPPRSIGELSGRTSSGPACLEALKFVPSDEGKLSIWSSPECDPDEKVTDRYLVVVDIGVGRTAKADFSVIAVFDRLPIIDGEPPVIVAQWYGRTDMDLLAWKAAQIATYYDEALLVIESNSYEMHVGEGGIDHSSYILNIIKDAYPRLYERRQSPEQIRDGIPARYGFQTNRATKVMIIDFLQRAVREKAWVERDTDTLEEFLTYVETPQGRFEAAPGHHDDRLMTRAIGLHICYNEMPTPNIIKRTDLMAPRPRRPLSEASL